MATGDAALAAGMDLVDGNSPANTLGTEDNKSRDYIAQFFNTAKTWVEGLFVRKTDVYDGQSDRSGLLVKYNTGSTITVFDPTANGHAATKRYVDDKVGSIPPPSFPSGGGTFTGQVYFPNSSPATSAYAVAYINGDGRLSRNASSERYKKWISDIDPAELGDIWPSLVRYQMRHGDGSWKYGYIAERLHETDDLRPFVVYATATELVDGEPATRLALDENGELIPDSIDFIALLMAQNAQLHQAVDLLEQRISALEAGR